MKKTQIGNRNKMKISNANPKELLKEIDSLNEKIKEVENNKLLNNFQTSKLLEAARELTNFMDMDQVTQKIIKNIRDLFNCNGITIYMLKAGAKYLTPLVALDPPFENNIMHEKISLNSSLSGKIVKTKAGRIFNYATNNSESYHIPGTPVDENEHLIISPMVINNEVIGTINIYRKNKIFDKEDLKLANIFALNASIAIKNAQIYEKLQIEAQNREKNEIELSKLSAYTKQSPVSIIITDLDGNIEYANPKFEEITGNSAKDVAGKNVRNLIAKNMNGKQFKELWNTLIAGNIWRGEIQNTNKYGEVIWESATLSSVRSMAGNIINYLAVMEDITERKKFEEMAFGLNDLIEKSSNEIYFFDSTELKFLHANKRALNNLGYGLKDLKKITPVDIKPQFTKNKFKQMLKPLFDGEKKLLKFNTVHKRIDNTEYPVEVLLNITKYNSKPTYVAMIIDISDRVNADNEINKALESAHKSEKIKSLFLANMSHEIRTPLNTILGFSSLIENNYKDKSKKIDAEFFDIINENGKRLLQTIHEIMDMSQIEAGNMPINLEMVDLPKMLNSMSKLFIKTAKNKNLKFNIETKGLKGLIRADEYCVAQSINNIVENAIKYTNEGRIDVKLSENNNFVMLSIKDTGIGISEKYLKNIFEVFTQESIGRTKKYQGVGLGLSLVKKYLEYCEATITIDSKKNIGSGFVIYFKKYNMDSNNKKKLRVKKNIVNNIKISGKKMKTQYSILVVEDDNSSQRLMEFFLRAKYKLFFAETVVEAKKIIHENKIDLILLDLSLLGNEDGLDLVRYLREKTKWKNLPVIATTAHAFVSDRDKCMEAGCNGFVTKPLMRDKLISKINELLKMREED